MVFLKKQVPDLGHHMVGAQDMWPIFCKFAFGQGKGDAPVWMTPQLPGTWCFPQHFSVSVHLFILDPAFAYQALCQAPGWWLETPAESVFPSDSLVFFICVTHSWFNSSKSFPPSPLLPWRAVSLSPSDIKHLAGFFYSL